MILILLLLTSLSYAQVHQESGPSVLKPFADKSGLFFMPDAMDCTFTKSLDGSYKESTCDYSLPFAAKLDGIKLILNNHSWGDFGYMTVRHPVGDVEVGKFGNKIFFNNENQDQNWIEAAYDAEIPQGLKIRVHYSTKSLVDVKALINLRLHKVIP